MATNGFLHPLPQKPISMDDLHREQHISMDSDTPRDPYELGNDGLRNLQTWLRAILEQHHKESSENIRMQFASLQSQMGENGAQMKNNAHQAVALAAPKDDDGFTLNASTEVADTADVEAGDTDDAGDFHVGRSAFGKAKVNNCSKSTLTSEQEFDFLYAVENAVSQLTYASEARLTESVSQHLMPWRRRKNMSQTLHHWFDLVMGCFLVSYCCSVFVELTYTGHKAELSLGLASDTGAWHNADIWFAAIEHFFNVIFLVELLVRVILTRSKFCRDLSNCFDAVIVVTTSVQIYILDPLAVSTGGNLTVFRLLRLGRTCRVLRLVNVLKHFTELRVLLQTIVSSARALLWSMVFLTILMVISALFLCYSLRDTILDESIDRELRLWLYKYYGSGTRSTYTLFEVTMAGCWPTYFRPLIEKVSVWYSIFVVAYISIVVFAVIRIISALFLKQTLQAAANDVERTMSAMHETKQKYISKLRSIFQAVDVTNAGILTFAQFHLMLDNEDVAMWLNILELEVHDAKGLFDLLDCDGNGEVSYHEFLAGVMRLKGGARTMDVVIMERALESIGHAVNGIKAKVDKLTRVELPSSPHHGNRNLAHTAQHTNIHGVSVALREAAK